MNLIFNVLGSEIKMHPDQKSLRKVVYELRKAEKLALIIDELAGDNFKTQYLYKSSIHGIKHNERVAFFVGAIAYYENIPKDYWRILFDAAKYHDIGRIDDSIDADHGVRSADMIVENKIVDYENPEDLEILRYIVTYHSINDELALQAVNNYNIVDVEKAKTLYNILKDADALDRVRVNSLNPKYLRTESAKSMVDLAYDFLYEHQQLFKNEKKHGHEISNKIQKLLEPFKEKRRNHQGISKPDNIGKEACNDRGI